MGLRQAGARRIICIDTNPAKEALARSLGGAAVEFLNPTSLPEGTALAPHIVSITEEGGAGGVDYSFECVGNVGLMRAALECTHKGWGKRCVVCAACFSFSCAVQRSRAVAGFPHAQPPPTHTNTFTAHFNRSIIIGVAASGQEISTRPFQLVTGRSWMGTAFGGYKGRTDVPKLAALHAEGKLPLEPFITHTFSGIESLTEACEVMHHGALRPVVKLA